jgi:hypothetical protein
MKPTTYIFLVLVLAAAIVTGSALAITSNFQAIKTAADQQNQSGSSPNAREAVSKDAAGTDSASVKPPQNAAVQTASVNSDTDTEFMVVSPQENAEIAAMLQNLGMTDSRDSIKQYQQTRGIEATGNLDSITLNSIINDAKIQRAAQQTQ